MKVTAPPVLALPKVYHVEVARSNLRLFCVCVRVHVYASGFLWKNKIELHSSPQSKCSKCPPLFRKHNQSLLSKFSNTDFIIFGVIPSQTFFILFIIWWSVHSRKQYFS